MTTPTQSYANHAHRPTATGVAALFAGAALVAQVMRWRGATDSVSGVIVQAGILGAIFALITISRTYVTRLQDRIIRLEMRVRTASLLSPAQQRLLAGLTMKQVAALRFASDEELAALLERASREQLKPGDIKRAIRQWRPDFDRT